MLLDKLEKLKDRYKELSLKMSNPDILSDSRKASRLGREMRNLEETLPLIDEYKTVLDSIKEIEGILENESDEELLELANSELPELKERSEKLEEKLVKALVPPDPDEGKDLIVEIRAGTGGDEAALFAGNLFRMYSLLAEKHRIRLNTLDTNPTNLGGFKEIVFELNGEEAYSLMKFESGVHRVQRVPETESSGRIHTSAASVAVLPEAEEVEIEIKPEDLKIDTYCSTGAGGQHVNRTESAVRITHLTSGLVVTCQDEKSQHKNKDKAMKVLRSRLMAMEQEKIQKERAHARRVQVGTGDRSAKIRTYNYPQSRITDHRINYSSYNLQEVLNGALEDLIEALEKAYIEDQLQEME